MRSSQPTYVVGVLQVEQSRPLLLPYLRLVLERLLVTMEFAEGHVLKSHGPLKPPLPQKHVQCQDSHRKTRIEGESGSEDLHAGLGERNNSASFNLTGAEVETTGNRLHR